MTVIKKAYQLIVGDLRYDPVVVLLFCISFIRPTQPVALNMLINTQLNEVIRKSRSIIRFGDDEALLLTDHDIYFNQPHEK